MRQLLALGVCAVLALGGCGGDSSDSESASTAVSPTEATTATQPSDQSAGGREGGKDEEKQGEGRQTDGSSAKGAEMTSSSKQSTATVKVPPISSAPTEGSEEPAPGVKTVKGGDNSVQTYGTEASDSERTEAAIALQAFLNERLEGDWEGVCSALASRARAQIDKFAQQLQDQGKDVGCAGTMAVLDEGTAQSQLRSEAQITEVLSFRGDGHVPGDPSYLIFIGPPGKTLYSMPMYFEGGSWKVGMALPSPLPV